VTVSMPTPTATSDTSPGQVDTRTVAAAVRAAHS
jgi:hypothetical protein